MKIVTVMNNKGGVGKTTVSFNLGYTIAIEDKRVLFVDLDAQGNLTLINGMKRIDLLDFKKPVINSINSKVSILRSSKDFNILENEALNSEYKLDFLKDNIFNKINSEAFDYCIIDTAPNLNTLNLSALSLSDDVLLILEPDAFSIAGLKDVKAKVDLITERQNQELKCHIVLNKYNVTRRTTKEIEPILEREECYKERLTIPEKTEFKNNAIFYRQSIINNEIHESFKKITNILEGEHEQQ